MVETEHPGITRFKEQRGQFQALHAFSQLSDDPSIRLAGDFAKLVAEYRDAIVRASEEGEPFVANNYCTAPELTTAMDLPAFTFWDGAYLHVDEESFTDGIDATAEMGISTDLCTLLRSAIYLVENGLLPTPAATVGILSPCDGMPMLQQVVKHSKHWGHVPWFCPDPPYFRDDRGLDYFAHEVRKMAAFLEQATSRTLDLDRLKEVIDESNRQYLLWQEYNELKRAVPCPQGVALGGMKCAGIAQMVNPGMRAGTEWFQKLVDVTEEKVANGLGGTKQEKVRIYWFDIPAGLWAADLLTWLEEELGAVVVMDFSTLYPYSLIDTSDEKEIWRGLARRLYDSPMIRQGLGPADGFVNDLPRILKDYKIDVVAWPGHMGHKEAQATVGIVRETCRDLGVPFLEIGMDLFDGRYTMADQIKDRFSRFFQAVGIQ